MGLGDFWLQFNNGKKHQLNDAQHGVRKEQVDSKFHNLFDLYDENKDRTLEAGELEGIFKGLSKYAGADKILNTSENMQAQSVFATQVNMQDVDFQGFVKSISDASEQIVSTKETPTPDGGKEIVTEYKDGSVETISYYPDGSYKFKKFDHRYTQTTTSYTIADDVNTKYTDSQIEGMIRKDYQKSLSEYKRRKSDYDKNRSHYIESGIMAPLSPPKYPDFKKMYMEQKRINQSTDTYNYERHDLELSDRAKFDVEVREFLISHFIETHQGTKEAMDTMGILDDIGAAINAGAGELWNSCKNIYNKWFGDGSESDYQNFYELVKKFEPQYNQALSAKFDLGIMKDHPELYFSNFETDYTENTGNQFNLEKTVQFQHLTEQYQIATIYKQRIDLLKNALSEIDMYWAEQNALTYSPAQSEGLNPATHILKANKYLLAFFGDDQDAADMVLNGTIGNPDGTKAKIKELLQDAQDSLENALLKRTTTLETDGFGSLAMNIATQGMEQYSYDELQTAYQSAYKEMYGVDFVPDELTEKVMGAKATGGMVKMAIITIISIIITRSPIMTEITGAAAGSAAIEGASANLIRTLVTKYGQTAVQQGIKFAMTTGTLATDVGLTLLNQVTSTRGVNGEELWESTKGAAKYIYFGAYVGGPIAQAVSQRLGQIGMTGRLLEGGTKATQGAIKTTTISGEKLLQNMAKGGSSLLAKGGAFATDVALFTGLEIATEGANPLEAFSEQGKMLGKLKIMNGFIEYLLGARTHTVMDRARWDVAIEKSGIKNWNIKEVQAPDANGKGMKTTYTVDVDGIPIGRFEDLNVLATAIMERVSSIYSSTEPPRTSDIIKNEVTDERLITDEQANLETTGNKLILYTPDEIKSRLVQKYSESFINDFIKATDANNAERGYRKNRIINEVLAISENHNTSAKIEKWVNEYLASTEYTENSNYKALEYAIIKYKTKEVYSDEFVRNYLVDMYDDNRLIERNDFFKITEDLGCPNLIEDWIKKTVEENPLIKITRAEDIEKAITHAKVEAFSEIVHWPESFQLQQMIKNNPIDAKQDKTTGEPIPEIPRFVRELIINNEPFANYTDNSNFNFAGDKTHIRALLENCLKHPDEYKLYQMILDNPVDAKFDKVTGEPIPDMPTQVKQAIKDGDVVAPNKYPGNQNIMDVREFIEHYLNNENLYKIRALILDNNVDMIDPNTGRPIYPITEEVKNFVQSQKIGTRYARPNGEKDGIDVNRLIENCLKNPELYELYELIKNNDLDAVYDETTGVELPNVPKYLRERIKSSSVTDIYSYDLSDLNHYATKFKETKNHFYGMKRVELQKYLENITDDNGNKITDISRLNPEEIIKQFEALSGLENKNIILDAIKDNILTDKTNPDYNKTISEFINETKDAKLDDIKLLSEFAKNSDKWEVRTTIIRTLNEPKTGKDNLIDSKIENRTEYVTKETESMINRLLDLKENCDNSLLNIDNILYLTDLISKEPNKSNQTIMFDEIMKLLQQKNTRGKYILNKDNIKLLINSDDLKLLYENPKIDIQSYLNTLSKYQSETVQAGYGEIKISQLIRKIYKENPEISDIESELKIKLQTEILEAFEGNPDIQSAIVSFIEKADYELIKNTIESYRDIIEDPTKITMEEILPTDDQKTREDKNNRNMNAITETRNKLFIEKLNNMNPTVLMHDIEIGLSDITDMEYKTILQNDYNKLKNNVNFNSSQIGQLQNIRSVVNAYKAASGMSLDIIEKSYSKDFIKYMASKYPRISKLIINKPSTKIFDIFKGIRADIEADMKYFLTIDYCKNNSDKYSDYLYEKVYLQNEKFPQELKDKCMELQQKYGVKIFISNNLDSVENAINHIESELNEWKTASNGDAFMPPVLDLLRAKQNYVDTESAYGQGAAVGFSETANGAISINGNKLSLMNYLTGFGGLKTILRHEMTHSNDSKHLTNFPDGYLAYKENSRTLDVTKCKFYDEFVAIGISKLHIPYAYNNPAEFIAVASEGDLSKASSEFKEVLVEFGMPEWRFKMH